MKFVLNEYSVDLPIDKTRPPKISGLSIEVHPYGLPPFQFREIWTIEISSLSEIINILTIGDVTVEICYSAFWSGDNMENVGDRLFGISILDGSQGDGGPRYFPIRIINEG